MMKLLLPLSLLVASCHVNAAAVFAHFMVTNSENFTLSDWENDISLAQEAHIDAFALNMAYMDPTNGPSLTLAFQAASNLGFKLFFSFDYAGNGPWPQSTVISYILQYGSNAAYYQFSGQPFVSTFEGPGSASDWAKIKAQTNCFFIPDWSSLGAKAALELGAADGLFSWAAWPWGSEEMTTYNDASYFQFLNQTGTALPYMMPASPWFFTNLPGYKKNWLWRGDNLWYSRWEQILYNKPDFVEIISWNDYGESHYIGPLYDKAMAAFSIGKAPYNYATNMPHDGWRLFLPFVIDMYKTGTASVTKEGLVTWYRLNPARDCATGGTSGNTASQLQLEFEPYDVVEDQVFFSALLGSSCDISVSIGGVIQTGSWNYSPDDGVGIYHGSVPTNGATGAVTVTLSRSGSVIASVSGESITSACTNGIENWNAWVGSATVSGVISATPSLKLEDQVCVNGTGAYNFAGLCSFACYYGYCPVGACTCTALGAQRKLPKATGVQGYPISGEDATYSGLCSFACGYGYCPSSACGTTQVPLTIPTVSDFDHPACVSGTGDGNLAGLCSFSCSYGYCPINACQCTGTGNLVPPPAATGVSGSPAPGLDSTLYAGLCDFACTRGYCPTGACISGSTSSNNTVYLPPGVWSDPDPVAACIPPCALILPPFPLGSLTTFDFGQIAVPIYVSDNGTIKTTDTIISIPPMTVGSVDVWRISILPSETIPTTIYPLQSIMPPSVVITLGPDQATIPPVPPGGVQSTPAFVSTTQVVTIQPQATVSFPLPTPFPSISFTSAQPSTTCTSGCGSDSCAMFGGCTDSGTDCGIYACGGGCAINGCNIMSSGIAGSSDPTEAEPDSNNPVGALQYDMDGPDDTNDGSWIPVPLPSSIMVSVTNVITSAVSALQTPLADYIASSYDTNKAAVLTNAVSSVKSAVNAQRTAIRSFNAESNPSWSSDLDLGPAFDTVLTDLGNIISDAVGGGYEINQYNKDLTSHVDALENAMVEDTGVDTCTDPTGTTTTKRSVKEDAFIIARAAPPACGPQQTTDAGDPTNLDRVPKQVKCVGSEAYSVYDQEAILKAMKQAINYINSPLIQGPNGGLIQDYTTRGKYPHTYFNTDNIFGPENSECIQPESEYMSGLMEFPIIKDGTILSVGRGNRNFDVGTDRVVLQYGRTAGGGAAYWMYCGVMTHFTKTKVEVMVDGVSRMVLPFRRCEEI